MRSLCSRLSVPVVGTLLLIFTIVPAIQAQTEQSEQWENGVGNPWHLPDAPKEEIDALKSRWSAIEAEIKSTNNGFATTYSAGGEMRTSVLRWAPESGFVYVYVYENFSVIDFSFGKVSVTPSGLFFTVEREQSTVDHNEVFRTTTRHWIPVRWGRNNYLIPSSQMSDFGNYVAGLAAYNDFNGPCCEFTPFLVARDDDVQSRRLEHPSLPAEYARFIKRPIEATLTRVGQNRIVKNYVSEGELYARFYEKASLTPVRLNVGKRHGVKLKMLFRLTDAPDTYGQQYLKITRVGVDYSEGVVVRDVDASGQVGYYDFDSPQKKPYPPIVVGSRVTTSPL